MNQAEIFLRPPLCTQSYLSIIPLTRIMVSETDIYQPLGDFSMEKAALYSKNWKMTFRGGLSITVAKELLVFAWL